MRKLDPQSRRSPRREGQSTNEEAFAFTETMICRIKPYGEVEDVDEGAVLFERGARSSDLIVVLAGVIQLSGERKSKLGHSGILLTKGQFSGELDLYSGRETLLNCQARRRSTILRVRSEALRQLIHTELDIADFMTRCWMDRRSLLLETGTGGAIIIGSPSSPDTVRMQQFLFRNGYPHRLIDLDSSGTAELLLTGMDLELCNLPAVFLSDSRILLNPTNEAIATALGISHVFAADTVFDVAIVGAGPSGLAAAVYAASEGLKTIIIDGTAPGGQAGTSSRIENYLGFPNGVSGQQLASAAEVQAQRLGAHLEVSREIDRLESRDGLHKLRLSDGEEIFSRTVVVATGARYRRLSVEGFERFEGSCIHYAATTVETARCRDQAVLVIGAGNSAGQAALHLASSAKQVHIAIRGESLDATMSHYLVQRIRRNPHITLHLLCQLREIVGNQSVEAVLLSTESTGDLIALPVTDIFVMIGASPNTEWLRGQLALDRNGFVHTGGSRTSPTSRFASNIPGVFAIGDVRSGSIKRVASAVGEGSAVVAELHQYLQAFALPACCIPQNSIPTTRKDDAARAELQDHHTMPWATANAD